MADRDVIVSVHKMNETKRMIRVAMRPAYPMIPEMLLKIAPPMMPVKHGRNTPTNMVRRPDEESDDEGMFWRENRGKKEVRCFLFY